VKLKGFVSSDEGLCFDIEFKNLSERPLVMALGNAYNYQHIFINDGVQVAKYTSHVVESSGRSRNFLFFCDQALFRSVLESNPESIGLAVGQSIEETICIELVEGDFEGSVDTVLSESEMIMTIFDLGFSKHEPEVNGLESIEHIFTIYILQDLDEPRPKVIP